MLELEVAAANGTPREAELLAELGRVLEEEVLDDGRARVTYERLLELLPNDADAAEALERAAAKRAKWRELVERYVSEANGTCEPPFRSARSS